MTQSFKDQLVKLLDTREMCSKHGFIVRAVEVNHYAKHESMEKWEVRLTPRRTYISYLRDIIDLVKDFNPDIIVQVSNLEGGSITLY